MSNTGNAILDNSQEKVVAVSSISITDIYDATPVQSFIIPTKGSAQSTQIYDKNNQEYNPDYTINNFLAKLTLLKAGTNIDISSGMGNVSWYVEMDNTTLPITDSSISGIFTSEGSNNEFIRVKKNLTEQKVTIKAFTNYIDYEKQTITPIYVNYIITTQEISKTYLVINNYTPNGFIFINNNPNLVTLNSELFLDGIKDNTKKRTYSWFRQDTSIVDNANPRYDSRMGLGWAKIILSDTTAKPNSEFNGEVTTDSILTILQDDIVNFETYVLITVPREGDQSGNTQKSFFNVYSYDESIVINIDCPTGFIYKNGVGSKTLLARVYTSVGEIDLDGNLYVYKWYSYKEDGSINSDFGGSGISYKKGKSIEISDSEFGSLTQIVVELENY